MKLQKNIKYIGIVGLLLFLSLQSCVYYRTALEAEYRKQADVFYKKENYKQSLEYYKKSKFISLNNQSRFRVAEIYIKLKEYDKAKREINILRFLDGQNTLVKELDAYWYFATGDVGTAVKKYKKLLNNEPYNTRILNNLGVIEIQQEHYTDGVDYFNTSLQITALPIPLLGDYMKGLTRLPFTTAEERTIVEEKRNVHISSVSKKYIEAFKANEVTLYDMKEVAQLLGGAYPVYAYALYKFISGEKKQDDKDKNKIITEANFIIAENLFNKTYAVDDTDALVLAFGYIEHAIDLGFGNIREEFVRLNNIREYAFTNDVHKKKINDLYLEKDIITKADYDDFLVKIEEKKTQNTQ